MADVLSLRERPARRVRRNPLSEPRPAPLSSRSAVRVPLRRLPLCLACAGLIGIVEIGRAHG
ncbi:hypothetical protein, partial [Burkholderia sp. Ac-20379]|uniref:hypothetical protein n=1 Tax=Burkholderia sp. Ac-20379 TaxID=2703900 RepID=UPI00198232E3